MDLWDFRLYQASVAFHAYVSDELGVTAHGHRTELEEASRSVVENVGEGFGRRAWGEKRQLYGYARGSAYECAALLGMVRARKLAAADKIDRAESMLLPIVRMVTRLVVARRDARAPR